MNKNKKLIICVLICIIAIAILTACNSNKLTMTNFNKIECATFDYATAAYKGGMTFEEVKEILGGPSSSSSSTIMGVTATAYVWGKDKKSITVSFYNGKAILKAQVGLK